MKEKKGHTAADAMDWNEAMVLINRMCDDGQYRDALLIGTGCYLGLRISDILQLKWEDLMGDELTIVEEKTGKCRSLRISSSLHKLVVTCRKQLNGRLDSYIFTGRLGDNPITRQTADQMLKKVKVKYRIKSAKVFSAHSLRKTFGRRVWLQECDKGRGDQALLLLADVFGHSNVSITKRYLGIRRDEILSVYDSLDD